MNLHQSKRRMVVGIFTILASLIFVVGWAVRPGTAGAPAGARNAPPRNLARIRVEAQQGAPVTIVDSVSYEISGDEFQTLTGTTAASDKFASFPAVTLRNDTGQQVETFVLLLKNEKTGAKHFLKFTGNAIGPLGSFSVPALWWGKPDKMTKRQPGWDSEKMWSPGMASDLVVKVGLVGFSDGSRWMLDETSPAPAISAIKLPGDGLFVRASYGRPLRMTPAPTQCTCDCGGTCTGRGCHCTGGCGTCDPNGNCMGCALECCQAACEIEHCQGEIME